jgi:hypothetical protein
VRIEKQLRGLSSAVFHRALLFFLPVFGAGPPTCNNYDRKRLLFRPCLGSLAAHAHFTYKGRNCNTLAPRSKPPAPNIQNLRRRRRITEEEEEEEEEDEEDEEEEEQQQQQPPQQQQATAEM